MLSPKDYSKAYRKLETQFNNTKKFITDLELDKDAEKKIFDTLQVEYERKVKGLHEGS